MAECSRTGVRFPPPPPTKQGPVFGGLFCWLSAGWMRPPTGSTSNAKALRRTAQSAGREAIFQSALADWKTFPPPPPNKERPRLHRGLFCLAVVGRMRTPNGFDKQRESVAQDCAKRRSRSDFPIGLSRLENIPPDTLSGGGGGGDSCDGQIGVDTADSSCEFVVGVP